MGLFKNLLGTTKHFFHIGGELLPGLKTPSVGNGPIAVRKADDSDYDNLALMNHMQGSYSLDHAATILDVHAYFPLIYAGFDGSSLPSWVDNKFYFCHTSGGTYSAGKVYYKRATIGTPFEINSSHIRFICTDDAISGTVSLEADWLYAWNGSNWEKKCDLSGTDAGKQYIKVPITTSGASSTAQVPTNAIVTDIIVDVTTGYDNGATIEVEVDSNTIVGTTDVEMSETNQYVVEDITAITTADVVTVTIANTPTTGAGVVYVGYIEPKS